MVVRPLRPGDLPRVGQLAGQLVRLHHKTDPDRFLLIEDVEEGYASWFRKELRNADAVLLVAEDDGEVIGYAYGRMEPRDWNLLLDTYGAVHDVFVDPAVRRRGVGRALMKALLRALEEKGAARVLLSAMVQNAPAHRLFESLGFRPTMIEMTRKSRRRPRARRG